MTISCRTPWARSAPCWMSNATAGALPLVAQMCSSVDARPSSTSSMSHPPLDGANTLSMSTMAAGFDDLAATWNGVSPATFYASQYNPLYCLPMNALNFLLFQLFKNFFWSCNSVAMLCATMGGQHWRECTILATLLCYQVIVLLLCIYLWLWVSKWAVTLLLHKTNV